MNNPTTHLPPFLSLGKLPTRASSDALNNPDYNKHLEGTRQPLPHWRITSPAPYNVWHGNLPGLLHQDPGTSSPYTRWEDDNFAYHPQIGGLLGIAKPIGGILQFDTTTVRPGDTTMGSGSSASALRSVSMTRRVSSPVNNRIFAPQPRRPIVIDLNTLNIEQIEASGKEKVRERPLTERMFLDVEADDDGNWRCRICEPFSLFTSSDDLQMHLYNRHSDRPGLYSEYRSPDDKSGAHNNGNPSSPGRHVNDQVKSNAEARDRDSTFASSSGINSVATGSSESDYASSEPDSGGDDHFRGHGTSRLNDQNEPDSSHISKFTMYSTHPKTPDTYGHTEYTYATCSDDGNAPERDTSECYIADNEYVYAGDPEVISEVFNTHLYTNNMDMHNTSYAKAHDLGFSDYSIAGA